MENSFLKASKETINNYVDKDTGEILGIESNKSMYLANTKEEFYLMNLEIHVLGLFYKAVG